MKVFIAIFIYIWGVLVNKKRGMNASRTGWYWLCGILRFPGTIANTDYAVGHNIRNFRALESQL